jgi:hypothetical protein
LAAAAAVVAVLWQGLGTVMAVVAAAWRQHGGGSSGDSSATA